MELERVFEKAEKDVQNADLKALAEKTLPTLKEHLELAEKLCSQLQDLQNLAIRYQLAELPETGKRRRSRSRIQDCSPIDRTRKFAVAQAISVVPNVNGGALRANRQLFMQ